jgi:acyl carrier protein
MSDDILAKLLEFISQNFMVEPDEINLEKSLVDEGIIDSFGLVEISAFIEARYKFKVAEQDMNRQNFGSVKKIVAFVERRQGECQ